MSETIELALSNFQHFNEPIRFQLSTKEFIKNARYMRSRACIPRNFFNRRARVVSITNFSCFITSMNKSPLLKKILAVTTLYQKAFPSSPCFRFEIKGYRRGTNNSMRNVYLLAFMILIFWAYLPTKTILFDFQRASSYKPFHGTCTLKCWVKLFSYIYFFSLFC